MYTVYCLIQLKLMKDILPPQRGKLNNQTFNLDLRSLGGDVETQIISIHIRVFK